jgi:hypothetical protein
MLCGHVERQLDVGQGSALDNRGKSDTNLLRYERERRLLRLQLPFCPFSSGSWLQLSLLLSVGKAALTFWILHFCLGRRTGQATVNFTSLRATC